ncbi:Thiamine-monophosphate kinase [Paraburkholderia domus]|jgi:AIR synthase-related protein, sll0787 family|uniref:Thiamine-monophosphate kinase n=1 Tax=Paraburkholderia domus TaxID=2793075 RepID=A0A9N8R1J3_9BURK|nr:sll0787 family AIR synthase-like protein [Paraburkholderia domus]MBK5052696.1 sll0787 family AIR synthase-like protein [Burkholderia sp. R-70006]MBK5064738.1 sll0787 family AIR synthase-like protein [Burkholderia sp. R-70199]MBK5089504.1 sll0787 family AIR synthase-like protein [Burkholderia sp. R-69927]MBK5125818.1 sll0787 family AIR synthase-like protein [Burkholderia sp. R-69980]MBK5168716.1 sll0787 family AIR synthase-like protein [Burkholderia sp. R-70211]MBK5184024.1 sll0787 family A
MSVAALVERLRASRGFCHKTDIAGVVESLANRLPRGTGDLAQAVAVGDDCAAIADGAGYLLFAIEGLVSDFVDAMPWFAGYSSVMVNVSDIYAMGGRPLAVVDALWSDGIAGAEPVLAGMAAASVAYGVPIVGGHSNVRSAQSQLAVAIIGRAQALLSSFNAMPGDRLLMAVDTRGRFEDPYPFWNASVGAPSARLRADLELLPSLAEAGLCDAAKDISMAGALGTALMLLECSQVGARIDLDAIPHPDGVDFERWVSAFPSFGFLLSVREQHVEEVIERFAVRSLTCAAIGSVDASREVVLHQRGDAASLWNFRDAPFIGAPSGGSR